MSFTNEARKVRNQDLPYGARVHALCQCLEMYSPLGFQLSWDYLQHNAGTFWRHRHAVPRTPATDSPLLAALGLIEDSRNLQTAAAAAFAKERIEQKALGRRSPHPRETTPWYPRRWHADPRGGALFLLERSEPPARLRPLTEAALTGDRSPELQREVLEAVRQLTKELEEVPQGSRTTAGELPRLAEHLRVAVGAY